MSAALYLHPALTALEADCVMVAHNLDCERTAKGNFKLVQAKRYLRDWKPHAKPVLTEWMESKGDAA